MELLLALETYSVLVIILTTLQEVIIKPVFETKGLGKAVFGDNLEEADFHIQMLSNGMITGDLQFHSADYAKIFGYLEKEFFTLGGKTSPNNENIIAEKCFLTGLKTSNSVSGSSIGGRFSAHNVILNPETQETRPNKELILKFGLVNVHETLRVIVDTELGKMRLAHHKEIKEMERLMQQHNLPLITSSAELFVNPDGAQPLGSIIDKAIEIVQNFLKISSLAQTVWHEWVFVQVYEKMTDSDGYQLIFLRLCSPKAKNPSSRGITNPAHSSHFVSAAWKGYSRELNEKYGFDVALEWYIESNSASVGESMFLNATTCLEMLMDKFHSQMGSELLLDEGTFAKFYADIKEQASSWLKSRNVNKTIRSAIYRSLSGINRRSYVDKAKMLLDYWGVSYADADISLDDIVQVRNDITHRGTHYSKDSESEFHKVFKAYEGLFLILTRIFLAMLKYDDEYYDPTEGKWIRFRDVCSKLGCTP